MSEIAMRDAARGLSVARVVLHGSDVFIETEGNHDGTRVFTSVRVSRVEFVEKLKQLGGLYG